VNRSSRANRTNQEEAHGEELVFMMDVEPGERTAKVDGTRREKAFTVRRL